MRNIFLKQSECLQHLMNEHDPAFLDAHDLSRAMHECGILRYSDNPNVSHEDSINNKARSINYHLNGNAIGADWIERYCDFFGCSADYFIGIIPFPTHEISSIAESTGLSEKAIDALKDLSEDQLKALDALLTSVNFQNMLGYLEQYMEASNQRNALERNGSQMLPDLRKECDLLEYESSTNFQYILIELGRSEENRRKLFNAMAPKEGSAPK